MGYCLSCEPFSCEGLPLTAVNWSIRSSVTYTSEGCVAGEKDSPIPGPLHGTLNITGYAFDAKSTDKWLGARCTAEAQASQSNIIKYNALNSKWYLIPSKNHSAMVSLAFESGVSLEEIYFESDAGNSKVIQGVTISSRYRLAVGRNFTFSSSAITLKVPSLNKWYVPFAEIGDTYMNSVSVTVDYPAPAMFSASFEFLRNYGEK